MSLLNEWRKWDSGDFPYVLDTDANVLESPSWKPWTAKYRGWRKATGDPDFCKSEDKRLHLGLIPVPFMGDMLNASIYVLMLNHKPGPCSPAHPRGSRHTNTYLGAAKRVSQH